MQIDRILPPYRGRFKTIMEREFLESASGALVEFENRYTIHRASRREARQAGPRGEPPPGKEHPHHVGGRGEPPQGDSFLTPERGLKALSRMNPYHAWRARWRKTISGFYNQISVSFPDPSFLVSAIMSIRLMII